MLTVEAFLQIDLPALTAAGLGAVACALIGSLLLLRRQAMIGDALSHVVLPGIVVAFLITGTLAPAAMLGGALGAALIAVVMIAAVRRFGGIEPGAAMAVVFTSLFAFGVVLLEQWVGPRVHLDTQHALFGALETTFWPEPTTVASLLRAEIWATVPVQIPVLAVLLALTVTVLLLFYKEIKVAIFDPDFAASIGIPPTAFDLGVATLAALVACACFQALGSILVIAMFVCPAAAARMVTDHFDRQLWWSALFALASAWLGYLAAAWLPLAFGFEHALSAAGGIAVVAGLIEALAILLAPRYGVLRRYWWPGKRGRPQCHQFEARRNRRDCAPDTSP